MLREALLRLAVVLAGVSCSCGESAAAASHENCRWLGQLPCSWGGCDFSLAPNGSLSSTGQCARETSTLYLDQKAIKYFAPGVFKGMRGMSRLRLNGNELQAVPQDVFSDLVNLTLLTLHSNNIASLPVAVFSNLRRLSHLYLYDMPLACANMSVQEQAALSAYWGPPPCPLGCGAGSYSCFATYGLAGLCHDLCTPCPSGKYSAATGATSVATCKDCAAGKHSGASATACIDCVAGKYALSAAASSSSSCIGCSVGKYSTRKGANDSSVCLPCPVDSISQPASHRISACKCNAGYTGPNGGNCTACMPSSYKDALGSAACSSCPQATTSMAASDQLTDCVCLPGFTGRDGQQCVECAQGKYKSLTGSLPCTDCMRDSNSLRASVNADACKCNAGFTGPDATGPCEPCALSTYKDTLGNMSCTACPPREGKQTTSLQGSTSVELCQVECPKGAYGRDGGPCEICGRGTFKSETGNLVDPPCTTCPKDADSPEGSVDATDCKCNKGFESRNRLDACFICPAGKFTNVPGSLGCAQCPAGKYSEVVGSSSCVDCGIGKYSGSVAASSRSTCKFCPKSSDSPAASTAKTACVCLEGYTGPLGGPCANCESPLTQVGACCTQDNPEMPCLWGGCRFSLDEVSGTLSSSGTCSSASVELWLNDRRIKRLAPDVFKGMRGMTELYLWGNEIASLPIGVFDDLINLKWLEMGANKLVGLSYAFDELRNLKALGLRQNSLSIVPSQVFDNLIRLYKLELSNNKINLLPQNLFDRLTMLEELYLFNNTLPCAPMTRSQMEAGLLYYFGPPPCPEGCPAGSFACFASSIECGDLCSRCTPGKFALARSTTCVECPVGKYSEVFGARSPATCIACPRGKYSASIASSECADCEAGTYVSAEASTSCSTCPVGKFSTVNGATSSQTCQSCTGTCTNCPPGKFWAARSPTCENCEGGKYSPSTGATTSATCLDCPLGKYSQSGGSNMERDCYIPCAPGSIICHAPSGFCDDGCNVLCPDDDACTQEDRCPTGDFTTALCATCTMGKYTAKREAATSCASCSAGRYSLEKRATSSESCLKCEPGTYSERAASKECFECGLGSYSDGEASTTCHMCEVGKYSQIKLASSPAVCMDCSPNCTSCEAGKHWIATSPTCVDCVAGTYSSAPRATSAAACLRCPAGSSSPAAATTCYLCAPGKYTLHVAQSVSGSCYKCDCYRCGVGKFSSTLGATSESTCQECHAGKFSANLSAAYCTSCGAGTYQDKEGATACVKCPMGTFSGSIALTNASCPTCCHTCNVGTYSSVTGATSVATCKNCTGTCTNCEAGKFSTRSSSTCVDCPAGKYSEAISSTSAASCQECSAGKYMDKTGSKSESDCILCPVGKYSESPGVVDQLKCQKCGAGKYSPTQGIIRATDCLLCPKGKFSSELGAHEESKCTACGQGETAPAGSTDKTQCKEPPDEARRQLHVTMALALPMSQKEFTAQEQLKYRTAIANAGGVPLEDVAIENVEPLRPGGSTRRLASEGIRVQTRVRTSGRRAADTVVANLQAETINAELVKQGLPSATMLEEPAVDDPATGSAPPPPDASRLAPKIGDDSSSLRPMILTLIIVAGCFGFIGIVCMVLRSRKRKQVSHCSARSGEEEQTTAPEMREVEAGPNHVWPHTKPHF